jgi:hypothetical protein
MSAGRPRHDFCADTARQLFEACKDSVADDAAVHKAVCINVADKDQRAQCIDELKAERDDARQLCIDQRGTRLDACTLLGLDRYDPDIDPALFDDPKNPTKPNPYFPLTVGNRWVFTGGGGGTEVDTVEVVNETKLIAGVRTIVFRDLVTKNGFDSENTDDWYAPAKNGAVWYFGEETKDFETFPGDDPVRPELVSIDGSFKAGRNGDKPGIIFVASPNKGDVYLEEFSLGNAEDVTEILSTTYEFGDDPTLDQGVPHELSDAFCSAGDCVVTRNFSLLEPGLSARKYYGKGIGVFLEIESEGDVVRLVDCNFDARCAKLPK